MSAEADLEMLVEQLREAFGPECLPINLPAQRRPGVVDCFFNPTATATSAAWRTRTSASSTRSSRSTKT